MLLLLCRCCGRCRVCPLLPPRTLLLLMMMSGLSIEEVKAQLGRFKGVGPKTIACVAMFCLGREVIHGIIND